MVSLSEWLRTDAEGGGWFLKEFIRFQQTGRPGPTHRLRVGEKGSLDPSSSPFRKAICHWSRCTPEIQVLPTSVAVKARDWLKKEGRIPLHDLGLLSRESPFVVDLMRADGITSPTGAFWQLSPHMQDLLTQMVFTVESSVGQRDEEIAPRVRGLSGGASDVDVPQYTPPKGRLHCTEFEVL